jgi:hypothetical protein
VPQAEKDHSKDIAQAERSLRVLAEEDEDESASTGEKSLVNIAATTKSRSTRVGPCHKGAWKHLLVNWISCRVISARDTVSSNRRHSCTGAARRVDAAAHALKLCRPRRQ